VVGPVYRRPCCSSTGALELDQKDCGGRLALEVLGGKEKAGKGERRDRMIEREDKMRGVRGREKHGKGLGGSST